MRIRCRSIIGGCVALALLQVALPARAITVYLAPIVYQDDSSPDTPNTRTASTLLIELGTKAFGDRVSFSLTGEAFPAPRSLPRGRQTI